MGYLRGARRSLVIGAAVLAAALVSVLFVVLPALATTPGAAIKPPSIPKNVLPVDVATGGQSNDCAVFGSTGQYQYRISNPKSTTYKTTPFQGGPQVTFTLTMNPPNTSPSLPAYANDKYVSFTSTGVGIVDVGIKGGTDEAQYNYSGRFFSNPNYGFVASDGYLHAPAQSVDSSGNPTSLYSVSNLTFCYSLAGSISGKVYEDKNGSTTQDQGESGLAGWTVNLRDNSNGSLITTTSSGSDGSYSFTLPLSTTTTYRVCEAPPSGTDPATVAQSQPSTTPPCSGTGELAKGYTFTPGSATDTITGKDFGNGFGQACTQPFSTDTWVVRLSTCKNNVFVFDVGTTSAGHPFVSLWVNDQTQAKVPLVEKITWPYDASQGQNKLTLSYTDIFPIDPSKAHVMQYCRLDPRDLVTDPSGLTLQSTYQDDNNKGQVLPAATATDPEASSCLISTTEEADGTYVAFIFSDIDSWRSG